MENQTILLLTDPSADLARAGGKAASLARLTAAGLPVPAGFCVDTDAYRRFVEVNNLQAVIAAALRDLDPTHPAAVEAASDRIQAAFLAGMVPLEVSEAVRGAYRDLPGEAPVVAVRSSATAEDLPEASFAGQQDTYLNICGEDAVLEATRRCWASLWTARAIAYRARQAIDPGEVALAVVVQVLVPAEAAGILFTVDPVSGRRDHLLINAAWGLGEAVVGGLVTPDTFVVDKTRRQVVSQQIAEKQVRTMRVEGGTAEQPVPAELRQVPSLSADQVLSLADLGARIENLYAAPMDIEWALAERKLFILQARPITGLPETLPAGPESWPMPNPKGHYMRGSIIDFMPDPLTPLFESLVVPEVNRSIQVLMKNLVGRDLDMYTNYILTIHHYGYMNAKYTLRQWMQMLFFMIPIFPRLLRNHVALWRDDAFPGYKKVVDEWRQRNPAELSSRELLDGAREVFAAAIDHLTKMQVATLGVAASSEGIFTATYNKLVKRAEDPNAPTYLIGLDSAPLRAEKSLFDLAAWCRENPGLAAALLREPADEIVARLQGDTAPEGVDALAWVEFRQRFQDHLARYGYAIFDLDFAKPLPMDDPAPMIEVLKLYLSGQGQDPYARQEAATQRREAATRAARARLKGLIAWAFEKSLRWAQTDLPMREDSIAEIGMGYPVIRALLRELGRRLAEAGALATPKEVYWLKGAELEQAVTALEQSSVLPDFTAPIAERRAHWRVLKGVNPPHQLPVDAKLLGMKMDAFMGVHAGNEAGDVIRGLGASPGKVTATARVLHGPEDFDQMRPGDVLVAAITTPAWTPLFAMASAVVTDIGGPLSHGSIVAREYGIPAVLGTGVATRRIQSGQTVTVDGAQGSITLGAVDETPA